MKNKFINLDEVLKNPSMYYAHDKEEGDMKVWEPLEDHTKLCQKYFEKINKEKFIDEKIERCINKITDSCSEEAKSLIIDMWWNVVTFHDTGKHNPNFQRVLLEREEFKKDARYMYVATKHSALSAVMYIDYYLKKLIRIKSLKENDEKILCAFILWNAYVISRHHSKLEPLEHFMKRFKENKEDYKNIHEIFFDASSQITKEPWLITETVARNMLSRADEVMEKLNNAQAIWVYFYTKLTYSMLVTSDYYATSEFESNVEISDFGGLNDIKNIFRIHQKTKVNQAIRKYEKETYPMDLERLKKETNINILRDEIFLDAERELLKEKEKNIFYLEAPTGSGKSNISMNLSFQLAMQDEQLKKIYYIYPFNTLIEQNEETLQNVFQNHPEVMEQISVVNSITPIREVTKGRDLDEENETEKYYVRALLNRQFLNYPIILTTHVSLFDTIFGESKESAFGFHQLAGSILVLDEIQSYKNSIWGEIINFLSELAEFMHMKIIIMSATLPDLETLKDKSENTCYLIKDRQKYFCHPCFQKRVQISKELLEKNIGMDELYEHIKKNCRDEKKILVEFITKAKAEELYSRLKSDEETGEINAKVLCMSGDDSILERKRTIEELKEKGKTVVLVATQVVEAGLDIDMDIGYKNISKMDSEEQFLGRINRSYSLGRMGMVYFFEIDEPKKIYKGDLRSEWSYLVKQPNVWKMLEEKDFIAYYDLILDELESNKSRAINNFFKENVSKLDFPEVCRHMRLIEEQNWNMSVFLGRTIQDENGNDLDGNAIWEAYKELLCDNEMGYAEKKVKLSEIRAQMNYFIYEIKQNSDIVYNDQIGELFYIEDGEKYFENGRLNRKMIQGQLGDFVDFI